MGSVKRIYVEKNTGCDVEASSLFLDLKLNLQLEGIEKLRILHCYDIENITDAEMEKAEYTVFAEAPVDSVYREEFPHNNRDRILMVAYLPGQYDQRADSAMQCVQVITNRDGIKIAYTKTIVVTGNITDEKWQEIKNYCINPVDSREVKPEKPERLDTETVEPEKVAVVQGFLTWTKEALAAYKEEMGLAMSLADLAYCQSYFKEEGRNPTVTEIRVLDTYWSDHCRHTTFLTQINKVAIMPGPYQGIIEKAYHLYLQEKQQIDPEGIKPVCLMDIALMGMKALKRRGLLNDLDESDEINACSIVIPVDVDGHKEEWLLLFKNETHNHPTEIEPFGGAATCLGGAIRDPLSGRAYVYQAMRVTGSGDPRAEISQTLPGKLPQKMISTGAAKGYSSYGNQIGLATGLVSEIYHQGYVAKRMEIGAVLGAVKKEYVVREKPEPGDIVLLVGGRTGRDGCGGATGSSKEHSEGSIHQCSAEVQKGNPPTERKLQRLFRKPDVIRLIKRCNDFGAGGVSVAIGELADGLQIHLDHILKKYDGLDGTELAISESQERMAVVVAAEHVLDFIREAEEENLEAVAVATVTEKKQLAMSWKGQDIAGISRDFLDTNGVRQEANVVIQDPGLKKKDGKEKEAEDIFSVLASLQACSQKGLVERFDATIGAGTVLMPFGGERQLTPIQAMAAKIPVIDGNTETCSLMSYGYNPELSSWSPFHGALLAVVESVCKIVATGGHFATIRLTFQEYFEKLGADPEKWGKPFGALLGALYAQLQLGIPAIGGKDSMSGSFGALHVPPALVSFAVTTANGADIISPELKKQGSTLVLLKTGYTKDDIPCFTQLKENCNRISGLIQDKMIISAMALNENGVLPALFQMAFGNFIGAEIQGDSLYAGAYGSFLLEVDGVPEQVEEAFQGLDFTILGKTTSQPYILANGKQIFLEKALQNWMAPLEEVFPTKPRQWADHCPAVEETWGSSIYHTKGRKGKPHVFIPVFPGTNCEYDTMKAFQKAGATVETFVVRNLSMEMLAASLAEMAKKINQSQIIALPGGFSAGDEPEGSGKFIAAIFRDGSVAEAVNNLLNIRDGLMLGICNGFQALVKLGLIPYGEICGQKDDSPTLTYNTLGRHISTLVRTKIVTNRSPWLMGVQPGEIYRVAASHGEGRLIAPENVIKKMIENSQIATQYVDDKGTPTYDPQFNPNGSVYAIEGLLSPDGRVFGKMGHSERIGKYVYKNVPGNYDQKIFESGVSYFF